jgi:hypothetical protein
MDYFHTLQHQNGEDDILAKNAKYLDKGIIRVNEDSSMQFLPQSNDSRKY